MCGRVRVISEPEVQDMKLRVYGSKIERAPHPRSPIFLYSCSKMTEVYESLKKNLEKILLGELNLFNS